MSWEGVPAGFAPPVLPRGGQGAFVAVDATATPEAIDLACPGRISLRRQREFAAGRTAARRALAAQGRDAPALPRSPGGAPRWPSGVAGSISHSRDWAVAVIAQATAVTGIGVDLERVARVDERIARRVLTVHELAVARGGLRGVAFSAKEAVYKAVNPLTGRYIGFQDAEIEFGPDRTFIAHPTGGDPANAIMAEGRGRYACFGGYVLSIFWIPEQSADQDPDAL